jgi:hypothetical protein
MGSPNEIRFMSSVQDLWGVLENEIKEIKLNFP